MYYILSTEPAEISWPEHRKSLITIGTRKYTIITDIETQETKKAMKYLEIQLLLTIYLTWLIKIMGKSYIDMMRSCLMI